MAQIRQLPDVQVDPQLSKLVSSDALIEALCLAHDIGHPPFGHGGEVALNHMMKNNGGFEANGQTFRIITRLEPYTKTHGMDLTRRTVLGLIKYPQLISVPPQPSREEQDLKYIHAASWKPVKGLFIDDEDRFNWVLLPMDKEDRALFCSTIDSSETNANRKIPKTQHKSFDASIMELADDIAYGVHDLEDAIVLGKVNQATWFEEVLPVLKAIENPWANKHGEQLSEMLFSTENHLRKNAIGALVNHLITNVVISKNDQFKSPLLKFNAKLHSNSAPILETLKQFVFTHVIQETSLQRLEFNGQNKLIEMFDAFHCDPARLLPKDVYQSFEHQDNKHRVICDYIASMSDAHAKRLHLQLFN